MSLFPKENFLFRLLLAIRRSPTQQTFFHIFFQLLYILQIILIYFIVTNRINPQTDNFIHNSSMFIGLSVATMVILGQFVIGLLWNVHLQLYNQLLGFRYVIFPLFLLFLTEEISTPIVINAQIAIVLIIMLVIVCYFLCYLVFQELSEVNVNKSSSEYGKFFVINDVLLAFTYITHRSVWVFAILAIWTVVSCVIRGQMQKCYGNRFGYKLWGGILKLNFYMLIMILGMEMFFTSDKQTIMLLYTSPLIVYLFLDEFINSKQDSFGLQIFTGNASLSQFHNFIVMMSSQLHQFKTNINIDIQKSLLVLFIDFYRRTCDNQNSLLLQASTQEEILNCNESNNRKIIIHKITKEMETLFQLYQNKYINSVELCLAKLEFYSVHLQNKLKIKHIISTIDYSKLDMSQRLTVYHANNKVQSLESAEVIDDSQGYDEYEVFKKQLIDLLYLLRQFWSLLKEEKVDIGSLITISSKLFPLKRSIESAWRKNLKQQNFVSWNIIKVYAMYCRNILHDSTRAHIFQDYGRILQNRIKNKQELGYMKLDAQAGVIAISLSESSLGHISSVNMLGSRLFNYYTKEEMLRLRVNDIMPEVFSEVHDNILNSFLKNRYKTINQDERFLFGKNKNGYIFPLTLQLRKLTWSSNDELIFISKIKAVKVKTSPIYCIVDLQGDIKDISSTFAWLFYKKNQMNLSKIQNIQWLLPSFFKAIQQQSIETQGKYIFQELCLVQKNNSSLEIQFTGSPLIIKQDKVGYLLEGTTKEPIRTKVEKNKFSAILAQSIPFRNTFNPKSLCFELGSQHGNMSYHKLEEFTIPFMRTGDIQNIFKLEKPSEMRSFGKGIKTFRLVKNKIQLAIDDESFMTEMSEEGWREMATVRRIEQIRDDLDVDKKKNLTNWFKVIVLLVGIGLLSFSIVVILKAFMFNSEILKYDGSLKNMWKVRSLLPQILIYSYFPQSDTTPSLLPLIKNQFLQAISLSSFQAWQKQSMIKLLDSASKQLPLSFEPGLFSFTITDNSSVLLLFLYLQTAFQVIFLLIIVLLFYYFQRTLQQIYSIFLSVGEKKLQIILKASQQLIDHISENSSKMLQSSQNDNEDSVLEDEQIQQEEEEHEPMKKFKKNSEFQNMHLAFKLVFPFLVILAFGLFYSIFTTIHLTKYNRGKSIWIKGAELFPEATLTTVQNLFIFLNMTGNFNEPSEFYNIQQQYESNIYKGGMEPQKFLHIFKGDPCRQHNFFQGIDFSSLQTLCQSSGTNTDHSIANNLNFLASFLKQSQNKTQQNWIEIIKMEFNLIKPLLDYAMTELLQLCRKQRIATMNKYIIMAIIIATLLAGTIIYIIWSPINIMDQKICFTRDLMSIIPSEKVRQPNEALGILTTEAVEYEENQQ